MIYHADYDDYDVTNHCRRIHEPSGQLFVSSVHTCDYTTVVSDG